jgi:hypothetical protein
MTEQEFLGIEAKRCDMSIEELMKCYKYEAEQQNILLEQYVAMEMEAWEWLQKNTLTHEQLKKIAEKLSPDPRFFDDEECPF